MAETRGKMNATGKRFAIIVSRWNELVTKELLAGAIEELTRLGAATEDIHVVHVPGSWEIPIVAKKLVSGSNAPHGILALGCILQGQTPHARLLGADVGAALMDLQVASGIPIAWGVLTPDTQDQALDRAGMKFGNKGREAAASAVEMASVLEQL